MSAASRRATYDDLLAVPDHLVAEIVAGELFTSPRPATPHGRAAVTIARDLTRAFDGPPGGSDAPGGWWFLFEPELHLGGDVLVPDLAAWRRERMPRIPDAANLTLAPDWAIEILSPSTARLDRVKKMPVYAREGVRHLWLVDPVARTLEVYRLEVSGWAVVAAHGESGAVRAEPFDAVEIDPGRWWLSDPAPPAGGARITA